MACLFSQTQYQGTAKALGMGNALGAVGGDMTSVCINPAGLGLYRSDEFTFSLGLMDNTSLSTYYTNATSGNKFRVNLPNVAIVTTKERSNYKSLRFTQFAIGLTRTNDYNTHTFAKGFNPSSSMIDSYLQEIDGLSPDEFNEYTTLPAWNLWLIDTVNGYYTSPVPQGGLWQSQERDFHGRSEEWTFAYGANFCGKLYLGASVGADHIKRIGTRNFKEEVPEDYAENDFRNWTFSETLSTTGWGANLKLGLIYHVSSKLRLGIAYHTPTVYNLQESWCTTTGATFSTYDKRESPTSNYEYDFISPMKAIFSTTFIIQNRSMISLDVEYLNYAKAQFKCNDYDYSNVNKEIADTYGQTLNLRIGSEWQVRDSYLRLGCAYYGSPLGLGLCDGSTKSASCGISLPISSSTSFDIAYELSHGKSYQYLYYVNDLELEPVNHSQSRHKLMATLKVKF